MKTFRERAEQIIGNLGVTGTEYTREMAVNELCGASYAARTEIAAMAMQGMLSANPECLFGNMTIPIKGLLAAYAVEYADALIAELEKTKP